jgi:hypothetical protein
MAAFESPLFNGAQEVLVLMEVSDRPSMLAESPRDRVPSRR